MPNRTPTPLTFEQWQTKQLEETTDDTMVPCLECEGTGMKECHECGHEKDCDECGAEGEVKFEDIPERDREKVFTERAYIAALTEDLRAVASWKGRPFAEVCLDAGYTVFCEIRGKKEIIRSQSMRAW